MTIDSFLHRQKEVGKAEKINRNSIIVIDEAGMIGSRKLSRLMQIIEKTKSKIVLVGDLRQLQPVEAGSALKMIEREIGSVGLQKIYRQQKEWQRSATQFFAEGEATKALSEYKRRGLAKIFPGPEEAHKSLVKDYLIDKKKNSNQSRIIIAETNQQAEALNTQIKQHLFSTGEVISGFEIQVKTPKKELENRHFAAGERILFTKNSRKLGVSNGTFGVILDIRKPLFQTGIQFTVKTDSNKTVSFNSKDYKSLDNGFAVTIHKSQGATLDRTFFLLSEKTSREAAYVAMSRHKKDAKIYIDRSSFSDLIDWEKVEKADQKNQKTSEIESKTIDFVGRKASISQQKDTSLDYKKSVDRGISR